jgi:predicted MPP superfamily phosphohydrolase
MPLQTGWKHFPFHEIPLYPGNFADSLKGLRIVQLSDLHLKKSIDIAYLELLVKKINALNPDLVVFTGDILQTFAYRLRRHFHAFSALESPAYYVTGNHDVVYGPKSLEKELFKYRIFCLDNRISILNINNTPLQLVGLADRYSFARGIKRPIEELFSKLDENVSTILLAHQPKDIEHIGKHRIDIQLSGHTHGGQIYPFNKLVKRLQPYFEGHYIHGKTILYVTRGLGYWGPSIRYRAPSEIPVFTLN